MKQSLVLMMLVAKGTVVLADEAGKKHVVPLPAGWSTPKMKDDAQKAKELKEEESKQRTDNIVSALAKSDKRTHPAPTVPAPAVVQPELTGVPPLNSIAIN